MARVVSGLAELGAIEPEADLTALRLTLGLELADDLPREGRFGTGVLVAPLGPASEQEWRIRAVLAGRGAGVTVDEGWMGTRSRGGPWR